MSGSLPRFLLALTIGGCGGFLFWLLSLPLPWLLGSLSANLIASVSGVGIQVPKPVRQMIPVVIGILVGTTFTPEVVAHAAEWIPSLSVTVVYVFLITAIAQVFCRKVMGMDKITSLFSGLPGGLSEMTLMGEEAGADIRKLTLIHACRVAWVLFLIPMLLTYVLVATPAPTAAQATLNSWSLTDGLILLACAAVGYPVARLLRIPADKIIGPMVLSAALHLSGFINSVPPSELTLTIQIVLGSALGARFAGGSLREIRKVLSLATMMTIAMMSVTFLTAWGLARWTGLPFEALILALSPGGIAEMALASLSLGLDPAFVTTHHALRLIVIVFIAPFFIRHFVKKAREEAG